MKQFMILFIFFINLLLPSNAMTISGGVSYTVEIARIEAFDGVLFQIDLNPYKQFFTDSNFKANITSMNKKKFIIHDRALTLFSDGNYSVRFKKKKGIGYYYNKDGKLEYISFVMNSKYPKKHIRYNINGQLDSVALDIDNNEQFIFDANKKLVAHWVGKNGYDEKGELFGTRD